jgi:hypothetical protein
VAIATQKRPISIMLGSSPDSGKLGWAAPSCVKNEGNFYLLKDTLQNRFKSPSLFISKRRWKGAKIRKEIRLFSPDIIMIFYYSPFKKFVSACHCIIGNLFPQGVPSLTDCSCEY